MISKNEIEIFNVAGSRDSKDPAIYGLVTVILELVFTLSTVKDPRSEPARNIMETDIPEAIDQPETVDEAVTFLISMLSLKDNQRFRGCLRKSSTICNFRSAFISKIDCFTPGTINFLNHAGRKPWINTCTGTRHQQ